jgi:hypothetical protein
MTLIGILLQIFSLSQYHTSDAFEEEGHETN